MSREGREGREGPGGSAGGEPALVLDRVTVAFGDTVAVDQLSLEVAPGEVVAVIGPSGSGKSTLLRAVAGLEPLVAGEISAGGRALAGVPTSARDLGLMFQDHALFPHLDVAGNVGFGLRMQGWRPERRRQRVVELLDLVGLAGFEGRAVHALSGGEAQRVALARALAPEPGLLMLDEPFGSLDRVLREELTGEVRRLLVELGQTALHVTHDQAEAFALADRVVVLRAGRIEQEGRPVELWWEPRSGFVAEFLGHPNIWVVTVDQASAGVWSGLDPGRHQVMVPVGAVTVDRDGPLKVTVESVVFREGRFRAEGTATGPGIGEAGGPAIISFYIAEPPSRGGEVRVRVSQSAVHRLGTADSPSL